MDRDIPTFNQLIVNKIHQKNRHLHERRLQSIRASQNSRSFISSSMNSRQNRKAQQLDQDKKTEIEKHNIMLFNRMKKIMNRQDPNNKPILQNHKHHNRMSMELSKIQQENRTMYERIEKQRSTINNKKFYEERQKQLHLLKFLGKYSSHSIQSLNAQNQQNSKSSQASNKNQNYCLAGRRKAYTTKPEHYLQNSQIQVHTNKKLRYEQIQLDQSIDVQDFNRVKDQMAIKKLKQQSALQHHSQAQWTNKDQTKLAREIARTSIPITAKDIILFKINKSFHSQMYQVKILRKHLSYEIRCNLIKMQQQPVILELSQEQGNRLLQQTNYDYKSIIDSLQLTDHGIVLGNYQSLQINDEQFELSMQDKAPQVPNKIKNKLSSNSSHISEQNQQQIYQYQLVPNKKPTSVDQFDCLDQQNQFQKQIVQEMNQTKSRNHKKYVSYRLEQKLQTVAENSYLQSERQLLGNKCQLEPYQLQII